jgi:hypothetical protein
MKKYLLALALVGGTGFFSCTMNHSDSVKGSCCAHSGEKGHVCEKSTAQAIASVRVSASLYDEQVNTSITPPPGCAN